MQIVDANVLLYATNARATQHRSAREWLESALRGRSAVGFPWIVLVAFLRLTTRPGVFARPLSAEQALGVVRAWLEQPPAVVVHPTDRHLDVLAGLLSEAGTAGNLVNDAHLAALAVEHGAEVVSYDRDFARFAGVRRRRPEAAAG